MIQLYCSDDFREKSCKICVFYKQTRHFVLGIQVSLRSKPVLKPRFYAHLCLSRLKIPFFHTVVLHKWYIKAIFVSVILFRANKSGYQKRRVTYIVHLLKITIQFYYIYSALEIRVHTVQKVKKKVFFSALLTHCSILLKGV